MTHTHRYILALLSLLLLSASAIAAPENPDIATAPATFQLRLQEAVALTPQGPWVTFAGYVDSRCPSDVMCGVAGYARALLWVQSQLNGSSVVVLEWGGASDSAAGQRNARVFANYRFGLISLEPRPLSSGKVEPSSYAVRFTAEAIRPTGAARKRGV